MRQPTTACAVSPWIGAAVALAAAMPAGAVALADGKLSIDGFGQWAFTHVSHGNGYDGLRPGDDFAAGSAALTVQASLLESGHAGLQVRFNRDTGATTLDWGFGEWRFSDRVRLRIGLLPHPFGISGDLRDVGTARPFFLLPTSVYGSAEITGEAVEGGGINGSVEYDSGWSLQYDGYFGALRIPTTSPYPTLKAGLQPGGTLGRRIDEATYLAGGRVVVSAPIEGLSFRLSGYATVRNNEDSVIGPSVRYVSGALDLRAEYFFLFEGDNPSRTQVAYVEGAWSFTEHWQVGLRAELFYGQLLGYSGPRALLDHRELAGTLNYWFLSNFAVKLSMSLIDGNRFANPLDVDSALLSGTLQPTTIAFIFGTQFSF